MTLRTLLFWTHLVAGVVAGLVILIMSVTGTLLAFQQSVLRFIERSDRVVAVPPDGTPRLDVDTLLERVRGASPDAQPTAVTLDSDPTAAVMVAVGAQGNVFVNPYTGEVLGTGSPRARAFYRSVTNWHRWLAAEGEARATARAITGACNAAFLVLAVSGLFLWWPKQWSLRHVGAVIWFRRGLRGKARDFNWHNTIGFWCAPVLIVLTITGMVISYTWASNLVYTLTGSPRPAAAGGAAGARGGAAAPAGAPRRDVKPAPSLESVVDQAESRVPTWRTMILRLPPRPGGPVSASMSDREVLEQLRALHADRRRCVRCDQMGTVRTDHPRSEGARLDALRPHRRARRTARRSSRRPGVTRRSLPGVDRRGARPAPPGRMRTPGSTRRVQDGGCRTGVATRGFRTGFRTARSGRSSRRRFHVRLNAGQLRTRSAEPGG